MADYAELIGRVIDDLGIRRAVLIGHSMGGRLVTELAASEPERAIAVILLDAIVGDTWDRMVNVFRLVPTAARRDRGLARRRHPDHRAVVPRPTPGRQARAAHRPDIAGPRPASLAADRPAASILRSGGTSRCSTSSVRTASRSS